MGMSASEYPKTPAPIKRFHQAPAKFSLFSFFTILIEASPENWQ
jgi:hypothetical protein